MGGKFIISLRKWKTLQILKNKYEKNIDLSYYLIDFFQFAQVVNKNNFCIVHFIQVHEKLKTTLMLLESQQTVKNKHNDGLERVNELIKGNMQRSSLISEGMNEARTQLVTIFQHKGPITDLLQRCGNKRAQKKRDK